MKRVHSSEQVIHRKRLLFVHRAGVMGCHNMASDDREEEPMSDELLDAVEIGKEWHVHPVTVRKWMSTGELRNRKLGRRRVSRRRWVDAFIDGRTADPDEDDE